MMSERLMRFSSYFVSTEIISVDAGLIEIQMIKYIREAGGAFNECCDINS